MADFGENTISPLEIQDARESVFRASELQREVERRLIETSRNLAAAERAYRRKLSDRILEIHAAGQAITACETIAKGQSDVADLRYQRDLAAGIHKSAEQEAFRRSADRRDANQLLKWSQGRDLRTDAEPVDWSKQQTHPQQRS